MSAHVLPLKPAVVLVQAGTNDLKTIPLFPEQKAVIIANCKKNIEEIVTLALSNGSRVILTTIFPLGELPLERRLVWSSDVASAIDDVNEFIVSLKSDRVSIFDSAKVLTGHEGRIDPRFSEDFLHLNAAGYEALNRELLPVLVALEPE